MDISDSYDPHQAQEQAQQQQQQQQPQQQMQCDPSYPTNRPSVDNPFIQPDLPVQTPLTAAQQPYGPNQATRIKSSAPPTTADIDIDSLLLQQFSCLGTTDHEDLINQFQSLMNNQMNKDSARFFLEMSNWNLQTAVGCYLDFCNFQTLPSMKIVEQSRPSEFQQAWRLQNDGTESWPNGCYLMSPSQAHRIEIPTIKPGETCDILAEIPPTQPALMFRLCTPNGWYYGETIWMIPPGTCDTQAELAERMSQLRTSSNSTNPECFPQVKVVISVNME